MLLIVLFVVGPPNIDVGLVMPRVAAMLSAAELLLLLLSSFCTSMGMSSPPAPQSSSYRHLFLGGPILATVPGPLLPPTPPPLALDVSSPILASSLLVPAGAGSAGR